MYIFEKSMFIYLVIAFLTFGYSANAEFAENEMLRFGHVSVADRWLTGMVCGLMWPLYWSYTGFKFVRPAEIKSNQ
jgi:hypothetical protein